jgi:hypothetical protein
MKMRFKRINIVFFVALLTLFSPNLRTDSQAAEWNVLSASQYSVPPVDRDPSLPMITAVGDFLGDANLDIAIGFSISADGDGRVYIFKGDGTAFNPTAAAIIFTLPGTGANLGTSIASIPDMANISGDGKDELLVGAPGEDSAYLFRSDDLLVEGSIDYTTAYSQITTATSGDLLGTNVASAGDFDGDGIPDLLVSLSLSKANVYLYLGKNIVAGVMTDASDGAFSGSGASEFSYRIGSAGNVNGDAYDDVIITHPTGAGNNGEAYIYFGGAAVDTTADLRLTDNVEDPSIETATRYGGAVTTGFDIDNDGFDDILIGAPSGGPLGSGKAYLYYGFNPASPPVTINSSDVAFYGEGDGGSDNFGLTMASFNANGDAYDDIVIGAPNAKNNKTGRVYYVAGKSRATLRNSFDDIMIGSFSLVDEAIVGEKFGIGLEASGSDLFILTFYTRFIKHLAITATSVTNVLQGVISQANGNNHLTAANSPYYVRGDLIVPSGETLTIDPGVTVSFDSVKFSPGGFSEDILELNVYGRLIAEGTAASKITFNMRNVPDNVRGNWLGINLEDYSSASLKYCDIRYGVNGIWVDRASLTLENSIVAVNGGIFVPRYDCDDFYQCSPSVGNGVYIKSGVLTPLINNDISSNEANGLLIESPSDSETDPANVLNSIDNNAFSSNGGTGILISDGSLVVEFVRDNTISSNSSDGMSGLLGATITGNTVSDNCGSGISADESTISQNTVSGNDIGINTSNSDITNNVTVNNLTQGAQISEGSFIGNFVGVLADGTPARNKYGVDATGRIDISQNNISYNELDGIVWNSNSKDDESPGIFWQNNVSYNGDSGMVFFDASPDIVGNNITNNGSRGVLNEMNGLKVDVASEPKIEQNNILSNYDMGLRLFHTAPTNPNEPYTLKTSGNWWGTADPVAIYAIIWDSDDDSVSILGRVLISPATSMVDISSVPKPVSGGSAQKSILSCFVANASFDGLDFNEKDNKKNMLNNLFESIDNLLFRR